MNSKEREQLVKSHANERAGSPRAEAPGRKGRWYPESASHLGLMLKCGVCLALVALLVVIGSGEEKAGTARDGRSDAAHPAAVTKSSTAAAHRKEVFDDRRARFEGNALAPANRFAAAGNAPTDPAKSDSSPDATCSGGAEGGMDANGSQCSRGAAATR